MSFDVHDLDTFVLVGSAVTLLAILAVRVSSRAGLPSLLIYLLMGVVLGESGVGILFNDAQVAHALGISVKTADRHIQNSYRKIGVSSRAAATLFAMEHGLMGWGELPMARFGERS